MIDTADLYFAAYLLTMGCHLDHVAGRPSKHFGKMIVFHLKGPDLLIEKRMEWDYQKGKAEVNLKQYLANLDKVRDVLSGLRPDDGAPPHGKRTQRNQGTQRDESGRTGRTAARN